MIALYRHQCLLFATMSSSPSFPLVIIPFHTQQIRLRLKVGCWAFCCLDFYRLTTIFIGRRALGFASSLRVEGRVRLNSACRLSTTRIDLIDGWQYDGKQRTCSFRYIICKRLIVDIPKLSRLMIVGGDNTSFVETTSLQLDGYDWASRLEFLFLGDRVLPLVKLVSFTNLKLLNTLHLGSSFAQYCEEFSLDNVPNLETIYFGEGALRSLPTFHLENFPELKEVTFGNKALDHSREFVANNNPKLSRLMFGVNCFQKGELFLLANMNQLSSLRISYPSDPSSSSFAGVQNLAIEGMFLRELLFRLAHAEWSLHWGRSFLCISQSHTFQYHYAIGFH